MSQSLVKNHLHIVFSTKHREKLISETLEHRIYSYLGGICHELECQPVKIGGYDDHVHMLCMLSKKIALAKFIETVKSKSSKWIKTLDPGLEKFYWQDGYGAFSVSPNKVDATDKYISTQRLHHSTATFQDEYRMLLRKYKIEYDEKYIWT